MIPILVAAYLTGALVCTLELVRAAGRPECELNLDGASVLRNGPALQPPPDPEPAQIPARPRAPRSLPTVLGPFDGV